MKASELRIGNIVEDKIYGGDGRISLIAQNYVYLTVTSEVTRGENEIIPMPLTEEWLLKFGFSKADGEEGVFSRWFDALLYCYEIPDKSLVFGQGVDFSHSTKEIEHVHQLQNLYFALTGEELVIEEPIDILKIATKEAIAYKTRTTDSK